MREKKGKDMSIMFLKEIIKKKLYYDLECDKRIYETLVKPSLRAYTLG